MTSENLKGKAAEVTKGYKDKDGFFRVSNAPWFEEPDPSLDKESRINKAIQIFEDSLEHKPAEKSKIYLAL